MQEEMFALHLTGGEWSECGFYTNDELCVSFDKDPRGSAKPFTHLSCVQRG